MITIFEGVDGIGKSYKINQLIKDCSLKNKTYKVFEYGTSFDNAYTSWKKEILLWKYFSDKGIEVFVSRCWLSENIYADIYNRQPRLTLSEEQKLVTYFVDTLKYNIVVMMPADINKTYNRLIERGDNESVLANWHRIVKRYEVLSDSYKSKLSIERV